MHLNIPMYLLNSILYADVAQNEYQWLWKNPCLLPLPSIISSFIWPFPRSISLTGTGPPKWAWGFKEFYHGREADEWRVLACSQGRLLGPTPGLLTLDGSRKAWGGDTRGLAVLKLVSNPYFESCWCADSLHSSVSIWLALRLISQIVCSSPLSLSFNTGEFSDCEIWCWKGLIPIEICVIIPFHTLNSCWVFKCGQLDPYPRCNVLRNVDIFPVHETRKASCNGAIKPPATFCCPLGDDHLRRYVDPKAGSRVEAVEDSQTYSLGFE